MYITIINSIKSAFINSFNFKTRSSRIEFWIFYLFTMLTGLIAIKIDQYLNLQLLQINFSNSLNGELILGHSYVFLYFLFFIPSLSLYVRRLHDIDRSGWWLLIVMIPFIGFITITFFLILKGNSKTNKYGNPIY
jgi:uncharacterized membrane protein YhaH (DUF805 family)